jgi:small-conductance mechanosensitive channel
MKLIKTTENRINTSRTINCKMCIVNIIIIIISLQTVLTAHRSLQSISARIFSLMKAILERETIDNKPYLFLYGMILLSTLLALIGAWFLYNWSICGDLPFLVVCLGVSFCLHAFSYFIWLCHICASLVGLFAGRLQPLSSKSSILKLSNYTHWITKETYINESLSSAMPLF